MRAGEDENATGTEKCLGLDRSCLRSEQPAHHQVLPLSILIPPSQREKQLIHNSEPSLR
jgi:hypothetical protein